MCEVTEECPSVIGSSLYIGDASERRTWWCRPAFFLSFRGGAGMVGGVRPRRHICAAARRPSDADDNRADFCALSSAQHSADRLSARHRRVVADDANIFSSFWRFSDAAALREESRRSALSLGGTAYIIYLCATHFEYIYIYYVCIDTCASASGLESSSGGLLYLAVYFSLSSYY